MATQQRRHSGPAAFEGDIAHPPRILPGGTGDEGHLGPILAAHGAGGAHGDVGDALAHAGHEVGQGLEAAVALDGDDAVIGADRADPAHIIFGEAAEAALGHVQP